MGINSKFINKFEQFALSKKLLKKDDKIIVGFSGGADSTALLSALWQLKSKYKLSILAAHINYNLRGEDSRKDEEFVKQFCFNRNISLVVKNIKMDSTSGIENNAREIRFNYFHELKKLYKINKIALGHNKGDQAETLLFRMLRGSGYTGLKGIDPKTDDLIHPLLPFSRDEITEFLNQDNIQWREDLSNQENIYSRNKIRNELLPWVQEKLNPQVIDKLYGAAEIFSETDEILQELAQRRILKAQTKHSKDSVHLSVPVLKKTRPILRYYVYKEIYTRLSGQLTDFYHNNFEEIESILNTSGSKQVYLPHNLFVFKEYNDLIICNNDAITQVEVDNQKEITSLRNRSTFEDYRIIMKKLKKLPHKRNLFEDRYTAYLDLDKTEFPLIIRHRQPGDRFYPLGMHHHKKLKDFFIDEKVSKFDRDKVLLFCDKEKILWIAGYRIDNRVAPSETSNNILMIKLEKMAKNKPRAAERIKKK